MDKGAFIGGVIGVAGRQLITPNTYYVAGSLGLGIGLASKSVGKGIATGAIATTAITGYKVMEKLPLIIQYAEEG